MKHLILASQSPRRKELLEAAGFTFHIHPSHSDESIDPLISFSENAIAIAKKKALHIASQVSGVILAADSFVVCENEVLGKPKDAKDAIRMLQKLSGKDQEVITGYAIVDTDTQKTLLRAVITKLKFKPISDQEILDYVKTHHPIDKAGAYGVQETQDRFVESLQGSYTNVVGLPMDEVMKDLKSFGIYPRGTAER